MCWEYWRCYPNPGIGRHNTVVAVGRENITINISQRLEGLLLKEVRGRGGKRQKPGPLSQQEGDDCWKTQLILI